MAKTKFRVQHPDLYQMPQKPQRSLAGVMLLFRKECTGDISAGLNRIRPRFDKHSMPGGLVRVLLQRPAQPSSASRSLLTSASVMPALRK